VAGVGYWAKLMAMQLSPTRLTFAVWSKLTTFEKKLQQLYFDPWEWLSS